MSKTINTQQSISNISLDVLANLPDYGIALKNMTDAIEMPMKQLRTLGDVMLPNLELFTKTVDITRSQLINSLAFLPSANFFNQIAEQQKAMVDMMETAASMQREFSAVTKFSDMLAKAIVIPQIPVIEFPIFNFIPSRSEKLSPVTFVEKSELEGQQLFEIQALRQEVALLKRHYVQTTQQAQILDNNFHMYLRSDGGFAYKGRLLLHVTIDTKHGKFFAHVLTAIENFISDETAKQKFLAKDYRAVGFIIRDLNTYLRKDGLRAMFQRRNHAKGYTLVSIQEIN